MWRILQQDAPDDYVLATGKMVTVRTFVEWAFADAGLSVEWQGEGLNEKGLCKETGKTLVAVDPRYFRPTEVELLLGDPTKAQDKLGWTHKTTARDLCREMVEADLVIMRDAPLGRLS
jgi:GDPmannose 4,6-dehydratase